MDKNKCTSCGEAPKKCSCKNKNFTKAVVEINNPDEVITLMRKVVIPASMGDDKAVPPEIGKYKNVLLYYEANSKSYLYSSDGIPTLLANGITDYEQAVNLPQINGVELIGNKTLNEIGIKAYVFDTVADMKASADLISGDYAKTLGYSTINDGGGALYFITDLIMNDTYQEQLDDGLLASIVGKEVKTSQLGLEPDDNTKGQNNFDKLASVMDMGYSVIVDNTYYLDTVDAHDIEATKFYLSGEEDKGVFKFASPDAITLFAVNNCSEIMVNNLTFINENSDTVRLLRLTDTSLWHVKNFRFINNIVNGTICVIGANYDINVLPVLGTHGFDHVDVINNKFYNLVKVSCFNLTDCIKERIRVKNNYIHNFTNVFFRSAITNDTTYENEVIEKTVLSEFDNNYVICDTDFTEESSSNATYYCFVLIEGDTCYYTNNHVEGMKASNDIALYDAYLSVRVLYSHDNVYKNNLSLTGDSTILLKSKAGATYNNLERYYDHNTYIIEEDWQKIFDPTLSRAVGLQDLSYPGKEYDITNCYIDVPFLTGRVYNYPIEYGTLVVKDNYIHCTKGNENRWLFYGATRHDNDKMYIQNNTIINDDYDLILAGATISGTEAGVTYKNFDEIIIENNKFSGAAIINRCDVNTVKIINNDFMLSKGDVSSSVIYSSTTTSPNLTFKNNKITSTTNMECYLMNMPTGANIVDIDNTYYARLPNKSNQGFILASDIDTTHIYRYFFEYEIQHTTGKQVMSFSVDYGKDGTGNYVSYTDTDDTQQTLHIADTGTDIKVDNTTSVTTSGARVLISNDLFQIIPKINYAVPDERYFVRMNVKSVLLS